MTQLNVFKFNSKNTRTPTFGVILVVIVNFKHIQRSIVFLLTLN